MSSIQNETSGFRFSGRHMLVCMLAFFGTIIAVNVTMAMLAAGTWTGLVVENSYVASQKFNDALRNARHQNESGLRSRVSFEAGALAFRIADGTGTRLKPVEATVWLGRPAFEQQDRLLEARCDASGVCSVPFKPATGRWALRIDAVLADRTYRRDLRFSVGSDGSVRVE